MAGGAWRVEPVDEFDEHVLEAGVVVVGVLPDERDHLPIAVAGLSVLTTGLVHHAEAVVAVVDLGEPHLEVAGGLLGLVELAGTDEVGSGVGRNGQFVLSARRASALASCSRSAASSLGRQHFLYLLPLPQG